METEITYLLKTIDQKGVEKYCDDIEYRLDDAKQEAQRIMAGNENIERVEIERKDSRFAGFEREGVMRRGDYEIWFDSDYPDPARRYCIVVGDDDNTWTERETWTPNRAIDEWCDVIKSQGTIERPWNCSIYEEIYNDDGEWMDCNNDSPWNGFSIRREH